MLDCKQRRVCTTDSRHSDPLAPHLLHRAFTAPAPNRKWLTDITAVWTARSAGSTWRWCWMSIHGSSWAGRWPRIERRAWWKQLCGWHWADANQLRSCCTIPIAAESHTSLAYQSVLALFHIQVSMSGKGDCYDNAMMESFTSLAQERMRAATGLSEPVRGQALHL